MAHPGTRRSRSGRRFATARVAALLAPTTCGWTSTDDGACHAGIDAFLSRALGAIERISYVWRARPAPPGGGAHGRRDRPGSGVSQSVPAHRLQSATCGPTPRDSPPIRTPAAGCSKARPSPEPWTGCCPGPKPRAVDGAGAAPHERISAIGTVGTGAGHGRWRPVRGGPVERARSRARRWPCFTSFSRLWRVEKRVMNARNIFILAGVLAGLGAGWAGFPRRHLQEPAAAGGLQSQGPRGQGRGQVRRLPRLPRGWHLRRASPPWISAPAATRRRWGPRRRRRTSSMQYVTPGNASRSGLLRAPAGERLLLAHHPRQAGAIEVRTVPWQTKDRPIICGPSSRIASAATRATSGARRDGRE